MTREERLAILGPETVAAIHERVAQAPDSSPELVEELRRIMTHSSRRYRPLRAQGRNDAEEE
ncbi:hypothetical protein ACFV5G_19530 [Streptomyces sp. NPDC059766]|uniref:hypothetical protein n=1 Tax=Streptomyces sp. NPDC059766 TaxID=3346940 RepID=UPI0036533C0B